MARMKAVQASKPGSEWEVVEREIPSPGSGMVRIKVEVCGICHSDMLVKEGYWPDIDSSSANTSEQLKAMGGARVILATAPDSKAISSLVDGLGVDGKLLIVAAPGEPITVNPITLIGKRASVQGWPSGIATDSEDTLRFSALTGVRPMIERFPLSKAAEAYQQMMGGKARFRVVLTMNS